MNQLKLLIYESKNLQIQPYIISPVQNKQDCCILAPDSIISNKTDFIETIYSPIRISSGNTIFDVFSRVTEFNEYINCYIVFRTDSIEPSSGRTGLYLTLGVLFKKEIAKKYQPIPDFVKFMVNRIYANFSVDIENGGAGELVNLFMDGLDDTNDRMNRFFHDVKNPLFILPKVKPGFYKILNSFKRRKRFPKLMLCSENTKLLEQVYIFISRASDLVNKRNTHSFYAPRLDTNEIKNFSFTILPCLPNLTSKLYNVSKIKYFNGLSTVIELYD